MEKIQLQTMIEVDYNQFQMPMITVYDSPLDFPNKFVARIFDLENPTPYFMVKDTYKEIRKEIPRHFTNIGRQFGDKQAIKEVWV